MNWRDDCPDWTEFNDNCRIQIKMDDGEIVEGIVELYDVGFDGEIEHPIWRLITKTHGLHGLSFVGLYPWRHWE